MIPIIIGAIVGVFVLICLITLLRIYFRSDSRKGKKGEKRAATLLKKHTMHGDKLINDVILYDEETKSSVQIDHILFSTRGIYVIETKNYSGKIYGTDKQSIWTHVYDENKPAMQFYSPVKQNVIHISAIKKILHNPLTTIYNIVIFTSGDISGVECRYVYTPVTLNNFFKTHTEVKLSPVARDKMYEEIIEYAKKNQISKRQHIKNVEKTQKDLDNKICPRCKGHLVKRVGKYGEFWGCENYPECRFAMRIKNK